MSRSAQIRLGVAEEEELGAYLRLPEDADALRHLLYRVYAPPDAIEAMAVEAVLWAYADWQGVRHLVSWAGHPIFTQVTHEARRAAAVHLRQALYDLVRGLRGRRGGGRWPRQAERINAARVERGAGSVPWSWALDAEKLEQQLLELYRPVEPAEAMVVSLVAYAHRDFQLTKGGRTDPVTDWLRQDFRGEAAWHLEDMVVALRRIQAFTRRPVVNVVRVRRVEAREPRQRELRARELRERELRAREVRGSDLRAGYPGASESWARELGKLKDQLRLYRALSRSWSEFKWMGKSGNRAHRSPTPVVEECVVVSVQHLVRDRDLPREPGTYEFELVLFGERIRQVLQLVPVPLPSGGGYAFECVCGCGRHCRKLYFPPGGQRLACRRCHGLLYYDQKFNAGRGVKSPINRFHSFVDMTQVARRMECVVPAGVDGAATSAPRRVALGPAHPRPALLLEPQVEVSVQRLVRPLKLPRQEARWACDLDVAGRRIQPRLHLVPVDLPAGGGYTFEALCACGRRARKLYLSPDRSQLVCPRCHAATAEDGRLERAGARPPPTELM